MANYKKIEGFRKNSTLYESNNKLYKKDKTPPDKDYMYIRCKEYDTSRCKARGFIMADQLILNHPDHTCAVNELYIKQLKLKTELKDAAEKGEKTFKKIYDSKVRKAGISIPMPDVISAMKKRRASVLPPKIAKPKKVVEFLESEDTDEKWKSNYYTSVTHEMISADGEYLSFMSKSYQRPKCHSTMP
jgi:hypothetical protein